MSSFEEMYWVRRWANAGDAPLAYFSLGISSTRHDGVVPFLGALHEAAFLLKNADRWRNGGRDALQER